MLETGISRERSRKLVQRYVPACRGERELLIAVRISRFRPFVLENEPWQGPFHESSRVSGELAGRRVSGGSGLDISGLNGSCQSRLRSFLDRFGSNFRANQVRRVLSLHRTLEKSKNGAGMASNGQEKAASGTDRHGAGRDRRYRRGRW